MSARPPSLTQRTYNVLRADILGGRYVSGERLRPTELAADQQVSLNVVREALSRLTGERLVQASPQQGFAVAPVTAADLVDLTDVRGLVETAALRRSIEHGDLDWEAELVAAHHRLAGTPMTSADRPDEISPDWDRAHEAFHRATMSGSGNRRLLEVVEGLTECAALYRHWSHRYDQGRRDVAGEHRGIFSAAVARDADLACSRHLDHIRRTAELVLGALREENLPDGSGAGTSPAS